MAAAAVSAGLRPSGSGDAHRHLGDLHGVGQTGPEMIVVGGDEHLTLAGQPPERTAVLHAVEVTLEARAEPVGLLRDRARPAPWARVAKGASRSASSASRSSRPIAPPGPPGPTLIA